VSTVERVDQIDLATTLIAAAFEAATNVFYARENDPASFPGYGPTVTRTEDIARRALGLLIAHGWTHPDVTL